MNVFFGFFVWHFFHTNIEKRNIFNFFSTRRSRTGDLLLRNLVTVNFETHPSLTSCFSLNINSILTRLEVNDETKRLSKIFIFFLQQKHFYKKFLILHFFFCLWKKITLVHICLSAAPLPNSSAHDQGCQMIQHSLFWIILVIKIIFFSLLCSSLFGRKKFVLDGSFPVADGQVFGDVSVLVVDALQAALV